MPDLSDEAHLGHTDEEALSREEREVTERRNIYSFLQQICQYPGYTTVAVILPCPDVLQAIAREILQINEPAVIVYGTTAFYI